MASFVNEKAMYIYIQHKEYEVCRPKKVLVAAILHCKSNAITRMIVLTVSSDEAASLLGLTVVVQTCLLEGVLFLFWREGKCSTHYKDHLIIIFLYRT